MLFTLYIQGAGRQEYYESELHIHIDNHIIIYNIIAILMYILMYIITLCYMFMYILIRTGLFSVNMQFCCPS